MTVLLAAWSSWQGWSFGRKDLWRVGFADGKVRFEVTHGTSPYPVRFVEATQPLYAGRWYHVAATLARVDQDGTQWSNLTVYLNGAAIGWRAQAPETVDLPTGTTSLYLGWDEASGPSAGRFKGAVDEFRLYSTALSPDAVRGLMRFLRGANSIVVPRGLLYDSLLFAQMTSNNSADLLNGPLAGATVFGNSNTNAAHLNAQVIQMAFVQNLTLARAYELLTLLWTNKTGNVTAFPYAAAGEFYTLGFAWQVSKLVANASVVNTGNYSAPPPPPSWWEQAWNTLSGIGAWVWNGIVAVATFIYNAGKWLVDVAIGVYYIVTENNWTYFQENVVEPFMAALEWFISFVVSLVVSLFNLMIDLLVRPLAPIGWRLVALLQRGYETYSDFYHSDQGKGLAEFIGLAEEFESIMLPFTLIGLALAVAFVSIQFVLGPVSFLISLVIGLLIGIIAQQFIQILAGPEGAAGALLNLDLAGLMSIMGLPLGEKDPKYSSPGIPGELWVALFGALLLIVLGRHIGKWIATFHKFQRDEIQGVLKKFTMARAQDRLGRGLGWTIGSVVIVAISALMPTPLARAFVGGLGVAVGIIGIMNLERLDRQVLNGWPLWLSRLIGIGTVIAGFALAVKGLLEHRDSTG